MRKKEIKLPKLPYGQGSFYESKGRIIYRKRIVLPDGTSQSKAIYGDSPKECMEGMAEYEMQVLKNYTEPSKEILCDEMNKWLENIKKPTLKSQSYTRLASTVKNQIIPSGIGHLRYQSITSDEIQKFINDLSKKLSKSSVKKTYDCLNDFYRHYSLRYKFDNPMLLVKMPKMEKDLAEQKEIIFFGDEDIKKFVNESKATWNTGSPRYQGGPILAANIFLGMRIGELLALQWKDIDFENRTIYVAKTLIEEANPDYDPTDPDSTKVRFRVQNSNKTSLTRYVPINDKALELIQLHKERSPYTEPDDYVISTRNRKTTTIKNTADTIKKICENGELEVVTGSTHVLRHSAASLYFRNNVPVEIVAKILGHSPEVCRSTYIHFIDDQLQSAAQLINVINV